MDGPCSGLMLASAVLLVRHCAGGAAAAPEGGSTCVPANDGGCDAWLYDVPLQRPAREQEAYDVEEVAQYSTYVEADGGASSGYACKYGHTQVAAE